MNGQLKMVLMAENLQTTLQVILFFWLLWAAVGCRGSISSIYSTGSGGIYWSSTQRDSLNAYLLIFHSGEADWTYGSRFGGFSVRSVAE